jgi:hypothetical protein
MYPDPFRLMGFDTEFTRTSSVSRKKLFKKAADEVLETLGLIQFCNC